MVIKRWETDSRYYVCDLHQDLLGDWVLHQYWGGKFNKMGSQSMKLARSYQNAQDEIDQLHKVRVKRGYHLIEGLSP